MHRSLLTALALTGCVLSGPGLAASTDTLGNLVAGATLTAGAMFLSDWGASGTDTTDPLGEVDLDNILVTATEVDEDSFTVTFDFNGELTVTGVDLLGDFADLAMGYTLSFAGRHELQQVMLGMEPGNFVPSDPLFSFLYVEEYVYADAGDHDPDFPADNALPLDPGARDKLIVGFSDIEPIGTATDSGDLGTTRQSIFVYKNTLVSVIEGETGGITRIVQTYNTTPEPGAWAMIAGGVALLGWARRRRR
jgi:hypothetical protein